uniref:Uncharacterized protein MANES_03G088400 n=1 Tax=Rhizophora mucronata TaxID=61149 RepID=A0A2P2K582_RHIMU
MNSQPHIWLWKSQRFLPGLLQKGITSRLKNWRGCLDLVLPFEVFIRILSS